MKIMNLGDLHSRQETPVYRIDDFKESFFNKLTWCLELAKKEGCKVVNYPGDLFHTAKSSPYIISRMLALHSKYKDDFHINIIAGNHDKLYHSPILDNTAIGVLISSGMFNLIDDKPFKFNEVHFYGASWNEPIPEIQDKTKQNILLIHKMIIEGDTLFPGQENYVTARNIVARNGFDLIVSGDNHKFFTHEYNSKTLLNMGSLCRMTTAQLDHIPKVAIYDTDTKTFEIHDIPIEPTENVFNLEEVLKNKDKKETSEQIKEYIDILSADSGAKEFSFVDNLNNFILKNEIRQSVQDIIKSALEIK